MILTARNKQTKNLAAKDSMPFWLRIYMLLAAVEALATIALVFSTPSEGDNAWLLGLSVTRWILVAGLLSLGLLFAMVAWLQWKKHSFGLRIESQVRIALQNRFLYASLIALALIASVISFYLCLLTFKFTDVLVQMRLMRLLPLVLWLFLFSLQTLLIAPQARKGAKKQPKFQLATLAPAAIAIVFFALIAVVVSATGLGLQPDRTGWDSPGVPLLGTQILIAVISGLILYSLLLLIERRFSWRLSRVDLLAALVVWLIAIIMWQSQPLTPTFFSPTPRAPNFEYYPYSDAATHDLAAQSLLVGEGFTDVIEKPLYSFFLAGLHALVGQDYANVVAAQVVVLAFFPAILYLLASQSHHRLSGGILAFAIIFREANTIALSGEINVSHSKLLMTDLPTAMGLALFTLLLFRWLKSDRQNLRWPLWVGAALGVLMLLRSQILIFLPILLLLAFWQGGKEMRKRFVYAGLLLLGFSLAAFPWLWRNFQYTGQFGYSQPLQAAYLAKQYSLTPELGETGFPEGTPVSEYVSLGFSKVLQFTFAHPGEVARFVTAHFLHNEISSVLGLPMRFDLADKIVTFYDLRPYWIGAEDKLWTQCCSLDSYVADMPYWQNWDGVFPGDAWLPVIFNLSLVSIGIAAAWKRAGWLTLIPISVHVFYNISTAVARVSGWRLALPVDWVLILFYCLGLGQLILWAWSYLVGTPSAKPVKSGPPKKSATQSWREQRLPQWGAAIFFAALLLPLSEIVIPARYPNLEVTTAQAEWQQTDLAEKTGLDLNSFLAQPNAEVMWGRALYPRFYAAGEGEPGGQWSAFNPLPFSRLAFALVGPRGNLVALPLGVAPDAFPNGVDVLVLGCTEQTFFRAAAVVFLNGEAPNLLASNGDAFVCATLSP